MISINTYRFRVRVTIECLNGIYVFSYSLGICSHWNKKFSFCRALALPFWIRVHLSPTLSVLLAEFRKWSQRQLKRETCKSRHQSWRWLCGFSSSLTLQKYQQNNINIRSYGAAVNIAVTRNVTVTVAVTVTRSNWCLPKQFSSNFI